ncbi:hypothetical protein IQ268_25755 [Oculatella sp. LEGE 06141]|uniref:hypothetical protein n=1 Tax=Oculatella sp. LEGE 06141 TaxID=1828648 RepID=UPI001881B336|nr:hypothetical protein [Oculatella sp. LEGE 06141]MBE9181978.1 hypothetical protein [Oculatella sp. LEGE 06141]
MTMNRCFLVLSAIPLVMGTLIAVSEQAIALPSQSVVAQNAAPSPSQRGQQEGQRGQGGQQREGQRGQRGQRGHRPPDFAAAAAQLGTTEAELKEALGLPTEPPAPGSRPARGERPRPDFAAAAERLGVTEEALREALEANRRPSDDRPPGAAQPDAR